MTARTTTTHESAAHSHGSLQSYITGFALSLLFTAIPYLIVVKDWLEGNMLVAALFGFAILQLLVQLLFFLHLGSETKPRWKLVAFLFAIVVVLIVVIGSIWIMYNLDYNMMPKADVDQQMLEQKDKGF
jgi:cytochrome o ubiquinol oxidase operon protein cyoD